jgi:hypothetical protein
VPVTVCASPEAGTELVGDEGEGEEEGEEAEDTGDPDDEESVLPAQPARHNRSVKAAAK